MRTFGVRSASKMTQQAKTGIRANKYFMGNTAKDVWTLTNEAAQVASKNEKNQGRPILNLGQGFFSYSPPKFAIEQTVSALNVPLNNQYSPTRGRPSLLKSLTDFYSPIYGETLTDSNVTVTTGANEGILSCLVGLLNLGDEVIVFEPFFDQYISNIEIPGGKVRYVPLVAPKELSERVTTGAEWKIDFDILKDTINEKTKCIILNTPHNPIGKVFTREELTQLGEICVKNNIYIISDEVYEHLYFGEEFTRIATLSKEIGDLTLSVGSAGKSFAATGWRIGWVVSRNAELLSYVSKAHTRICFSSPSPFQEACAHSIEIGLQNGYFENMREEYKQKFAILTGVFDELALPYTEPDGTYFVCVDFSKVKIPVDYPFPEELDDKAKDFKLSYWLVNELGVVAIPPTEFYIKEHEKAAENLLRFAVCKDDEYLKESVERLRLLKNYL